MWSEAEAGRRIFSEDAKNKVQPHREELRVSGGEGRWKQGHGVEGEAHRR